MKTPEPLTNKSVNVGTPGHIDHGTSQGAAELNGVVIPKSYLIDLEKARIAVFELFPDADIAMLIRLQNITEPMFKLTHRHWPEVNTK